MITHHYNYDLFILIFAYCKSENQFWEVKITSKRWLNIVFLTWQDKHKISPLDSCAGQLRSQTSGSCTPFQYPKRRLIIRSCEVSKQRDLYLELSDRSEIWQAHRQHCCRCACQISKWYDNLKYQSRGFETSRDLTIRRLFGYWDGALVSI